MEESSAEGPRSHPPYSARAWRRVGNIRSPMTIPREPHLLCGYPSEIGNSATELRILAHQLAAGLFTDCEHLLAIPAWQRSQVVQGSCCQLKWTLYSLAE